MKSIEIEIKVAALFDYRRCVIVPNISWGAGLHECDMLIIRRSGAAIEVEIKVTKSDLKKDMTKRHSHESNRIKELYYAVPEKLAAFTAELLPDDIGVISVTPGAAASIIRPAKIRPGSRPLNEKEIANVARLGTMRIWNLKRKIRELTK